MTEPLLSPEAQSSLAFWGNGMHDLVYCFQRITDMAGSAYQRDGAGTGVNAGAAAGKFAWYGRDKFPLLKQGGEDWKNYGGKLKLPTATFVVDATMVLVAIVGMVNGFVPPDSGDDFSTGCDKFETVYADLELAVADPRDWSGDAADSYANQNAALQQQVQDMETLDRSMQLLIAAQGTQVQNTRLVITSVLFGLIAAQGIALALYAWSPSAAVIWQVVIALAAIGLVLWIETETGLKSQSHADAMDNIGDGYDAVAAGKPLPSTFSQIQVPGAEETRISSFTDLLDSMSSAPACSAMPSIAMLARLIPQSAFTENLTLFGVPVVADEVFPEMPPAAAASGAPATALGKQAQSAATPAKQAAAQQTTYAENIEGAEAGTSMPAGARAPIEIATASAKQTQELNSLQPIM